MAVEATSEAEKEPLKPTIKRREHTLVTFADDNLNVSLLFLGCTFYPGVVNSLNPNLNLYSISSFWAKGWFRNVSTWRKQIDPVFQTHDWNLASNPNCQIDIVETRQFSFSSSIFLRIPTLGIPENFEISRLPISYLFSIQIYDNCHIGVFEIRCSKSKFNLR